MAEQLLKSGPTLHQRIRAYEAGEYHVIHPIFHDLHVFDWQQPTRIEARPIFFDSQFQETAPYDRRSKLFVYILYFNTMYGYRKMGHGTHAMEYLVGLLDRYHLPAYLLCSPDKMQDQAWVHKWYRRFGFSGIGLEDNLFMVRECE